MMRTQVAIVGGGYAGSCVAAALQHRRVDGVAWIDAGGAKSSDVRVALVHPFAGRSFAMRPGVPQAWAAAREHVAWLGPEVSTVQAPVRRFATASDGQRLARSLQEHGRALRESFGTAAPRELGGAQPCFEYDAAFAFDMRAAVEVTRARFCSAGEDTIDDTVRAMHAHEGAWTLEFAKREPLQVRHVVVAAGVSSTSLLPRHLPTERFEVVEGALVVAAPSAQPRFTIAGGHFSSTRQHSAWGSSYAPHGAPADAHDEQLDAVRKRLASHVELESAAECSRWVGQRLVDRRTRLPSVRTVSEGLHVCTAFGSQAGLWAPMLTARLVDTLRLD